MNILNPLRTSPLLGAAIILSLAWPCASAAGSIRVRGVERLPVAVDFPVALCQQDAATILFTEKDGRVLVIKNGALQTEPLAKLNVATGFERGLLGIACGGGGVYAYHSYANVWSTYNRVVRLNPYKVILDRIPGAVFHNGGALALGPDGMVYISTGDARDEASAQDIKSLAGKILRITRDGGIPADNPFTGSPVWSLGHRNVFGMAFSGRGELFITENGTSRDDEINIIVKGANYGWPVALGRAGDSRYKDPIRTYTPNIAPTNATFIKDWFVFGTWNTGELKALKVEEGEVVEEMTLYKSDSGITDAKYFSDGNLYFTSPGGVFKAALELDE